ncbi:MAG: EamA family transporter [Acidimicrobiia bacterium]|nr:EamA family transporter [Acidimicrobiia bacterium]
MNANRRSLKEGRPQFSPLWAAIIGATAISFSAIFFKLAEVSPATGALFRFLYALPLLAILWWRSGERKPRSKRARLLAMVAGVLLGLDVLTWHIAIENIGTGLATLIVNSQVVIVALLAWLLLGEKPSNRVFTAIPIMLVGVAMVSGLGLGNAFGENPLVGTVMALLAALFYAGFLLGFRRTNRWTAPSAGPLFDATVGAALVSVVVGLAISGLDPVPSFPAHGWLMALALSAQVVGWLIIGYALPRLPAAETSTVILIQPVMTMLWGILIFGERPSTLQLMGALFVLAGVGLVASTRRSNTPVIEPITKR